MLQHPNAKGAIDELFTDPGAKSACHEEQPFSARLWQELDGTFTPTPVRDQLSEQDECDSHAEEEAACSRERAPLRQTKLGASNFDPEQDHCRNGQG